VTGPGRASFVDAITPLRVTLEDKAACYGQMDRAYLIAVLCEAEISTDDYDIEGALFGHEAVAFDPLRKAERVHLLPIDPTYTTPFATAGEE
jgi:hypothetical protein